MGVDVNGNPSQLNAYDAPAALEPNGKVLLIAGNKYSNPSTFFEYDPATNTFAKVSDQTVAPQIGPYYTRMLDLPTGQILFNFGGQQALIYTPIGTADPAWKPAITAITANADGTYHLTGLQLNGLSEGAAYGDDASMSSNYPLVRLTNAQGHVYYARTFNFSSMGVATGATPVSADFALPTGLPKGSFSLVAVANGIASSAFSFTPAPEPSSIAALLMGALGLGGLTLRARKTGTRHG